MLQQVNHIQAQNPFSKKLNTPEMAEKIILPPHKIEPIELKSSFL